MLFTKKSVPFDKTGLFSDLILDFIYTNKNVKPFIKHFPSLDSVRLAISDMHNQHRETLVNTLKEQYKNTSFIDSNMQKVKKNITKLLTPKSYTVTTGHQINMFASPLFLIYKITSIIAYSNYLNQNIKDYHCVPCFWMATEDHDFKEINNMNLCNETYVWNLTTKNAVGNLIPKSITPILKKIENILKVSDFGNELYQIYNHAYRKNTTYANATRSLLTAFFHKYGLIVVDGNHPNLKRLFINHFQTEITNNTTFHNIYKTNKLISKKYKPEINALKSNIFYLSNSIRSKIQFDSKKYFSIEHGKQWLKTELLDEISLYPERFSPNVFLRTLYQQHIMPNILYIGGASEISYWLQLKGVFKSLKVNYPLLELRSAFLILSKKESKLKSKHGLTDAELFLSHHQKIKKVLKKKSDFKLNEFIKELDFLLSKKAKKIKTIDNFPTHSFHVFEKKLKKELLKFESKVIRFEKTKNKNLVDQFIRVDNKLFPNNSIQERICSFIPFYMKYGKSFFQLLIKESSIFDNKYIILTEKQ